MEKSSVLRIGAILLLYTWGKVEGFFNIDTREPILRRSPGLLNESHLETYGPDYFGLGIALHEYEMILDGDGASEAAGKTRVIVGAPWGTFPGGLPLEDPGEAAVDRTGLVYSCPISPGEMCDPVHGNDQTGDMSGEGDDVLTITVDNDFLASGSRLFDHRPNAEIFSRFGVLLPAEQKRGQFLGATVFSRGGLLVVCAPVWVSSGEYNPDISRMGNAPASSNAFPQGRCYTAERDLSSVDFLDPCNDGEGDISIDDGYCTAGTGVEMLETGRYVIGAPGYLYGVGSVFYGRTQEEMTMRGDQSAGLGNTKHQTEEDGEQSIREVSQGFRVATGYITISRTATDSPPNVLASVPRFDSSKYLGKIDVYDARESDGNIEMLLDISAEGTQIGEFFGYDLDTLDVNGDNYDEVVVGAPMYSQISSNKELKVESGRVYVFMNTGPSAHVPQGSLSTVPIIFEGAVSRARLGMSVLNIGDIDRDGYEDFAVGAPYERQAGGDSTGAVYIYYGNPDITAFREQTPDSVSSQVVADRLQPVDNLKTFGLSLSVLDFDNNQHNDLAVGAFESASVVLLRSRPVLNVEVTMTPSKTAVVRADTTCRVDGDDYACFDVTVILTSSSRGLPNEQVVMLALREVRSDDEARVFFNGDPDQNKFVTSVSLSPDSTSITTVYLQNGITDSNSPLELVAEVLPNPVRQPSPGDGHPNISDLAPDFIIRTSAVSSQVNLTNNCGAEQRCETDFAISSEGTLYLPNREGVTYKSIEVGGVTAVVVSLTISNNGDEDAIVLVLEVEHDDDRVFGDRVKIGVDDTTVECAPRVQQCNVRDVFAGQSKVITVTMEVRADAPPGVVATTFTLDSSATTDSDASNNTVTVPFTVENRADLTVSVIFPLEQAMYANEEPGMPEQRSDVGTGVAMEVRVRNTRSTDVGTATVDIFYPASAAETGDLFFLLPDCEVTTTITEGGAVSCEDSFLSDEDPLACDSARRKRHAVSASVRRRLRRAVEADAAGLRRTPRVTTSLDCSATPEDCLFIRCTISQLRGLAANEARISLRGFVDDRFFFDKDVVYELTAMANVTFDAEAEGISDHGEQPDRDTAKITISPPRSMSESRGESNLTIIFVILAVIIAPIIIITIVTLILWRCGFFKRKRREGEGEGEEEVVPTLPAETKPEGTNL
jgi:integrin alpha 8